MDMKSLKKAGFNCGLCIVYKAPRYEIQDGENRLLKLIYYYESLRVIVKKPELSKLMEHIM